MTIGELGVRITTLDDCTAMLLDVYLENISSNMSPECKAMYEALKSKIREARDSAWDEFSGRIHEMSKQA